MKAYPGHYLLSKWANIISADNAGIGPLNAVHVGDVPTCDNALHTGIYRSNEIAAISTKMTKCHQSMAIPGHTFLMNFSKIHQSS